MPSERALPWHWLLVGLSAIGCAQLIGADFGDYEIGGAGAAGATGGAGGGAAGGGGGQAGAGGDAIECDPLPCNGEPWLRAMGQTGDQWSGPVALGVDGEVALGVSFENAINLGGATFQAVAGSFDLGVALYEPGGEHRWSRQFGDGFPQYAFDVGLTNFGAVVVAGAFEGELAIGTTPLSSVPGQVTGFIAQLSAGAGDPEWATSIQAPGIVRAVAVDRASDVIAVLAYATGPVDFGVSASNPPDRCTFAPTVGPNAIIVASLNNDGTCNWIRGFESLDGNVAFPDTVTYSPGEVAFGASGDVYATGIVNGDVDFGNGPIENTVNDLFVARLDRFTGAEVWARAFGDGGDGFQAGWGIVVEPDGAADGSVWVAGDVFGAVQFGSTLVPGDDMNALLLELDAGDGSALFATAVSGPGMQEGRGLVEYGPGSLLMSGIASGTATFDGFEETMGNGDLFLVRVTTETKTLDWRLFGDDAGVTSLGLAGASCCHPVLAGQFEGTLDLGVEGPQASAGMDDVFVARVPPP